jgi:hypothetical protein
MKKIITIIGSVAFLMTVSSCALMFNGTKKRVTIISDTPHSEIYVDGRLAGTENVSIKLKRKEDHIITAKKVGCKPQTVALDKELQMGWIAFYLFINPFALITDAPTGAWYGFERSTVVVPELNCKQ